MKLWRTLFEEWLAEAKLELVAMADCLMIFKYLFFLHELSSAEVAATSWRLITGIRLCLYTSFTTRPRASEAGLGSFKRNFKYFSRKPFVLGLTIKCLQYFQLNISQKLLFAYYVSFIYCEMIQKIMQWRDSSLVWIAVSPLVLAQVAAAVIHCHCSW